MSHPTRLDLLRSYIDRLACDMGAQGKFAARSANRIEAAVAAVLNGGSAMAAQMWEDVKSIGGEKAAMAVPIIEGAAAGLAADGARAAVGWAGGAIKDLFNGRASEKQAQRRAAGKALMEGAAKMGSGAHGGRK